MQIDFFKRQSEEKVSDMVRQAENTIKEGNKAVIVLSDSALEYDDFLTKNLGVKATELTSEDTELYYFSRNVSFALAVEKELYSRGYSTAIVNYFDPPGENSAKDLVNLIVERIHLISLFETNEAVIVCVLNRDIPQSDNDAVFIENSGIYTGAVVVPDVIEVKALFEDNFALMCNELFRELALAEISLDMINICHNELYFICSQKDREKVVSVMKNRDYIISDNLVKFSVIGLGMKGTPGIMAGIYSAFKSRNIPIIRITDSHTSISCLLSMEYLDAAIKLVQEVFSVPENRIVAGK